jgi:uncharacterized protein (DUF1501 family)
MRASRRQFLKTCSLMSVAGAAGPFALNLAAISAASAATSPGYKALVCLFFYGGNDHTNTFIPYDPTSTDGVSYDQYLASRDTIAIPYAQLAATSTGAVASQGGHSFAFHPALTAFKAHWDAGKLAVVANVGPLIVPTSRAQYQQSNWPKPPKLFSHNDQQSVWQAYQPIGEGAKIGWGGRIGDLLMSQNTNTLFTCISAGGNSVFLSGASALQYQVGSSGPQRVTAIPPTATLFGSSAAPAAYETLIKSTSPNLFENELGVVTNRSITANQQLTAALQGAPVLNPTVPQNNNLASQLSVVARIISVADALGTNRQVFLVSIGGFDNHDVLLTQHAQQLTQVNNAVNAFYAWLVQLGVQNQVTLFTASDFGRTLTSNGDGSDHGWGSHHFVLGGAVQGGNVYGTFRPTTFFSSANSNPVDIGQGNMVPEIAVDQYAATFARWLGVSDADVPLVLPNVPNFGSSRYLAFL